MNRATTKLKPLALLGLGLLIGCTSNVRESAPGEDPKVAIEEARADARAMASSTLQDLYRMQPEAKSAIENAPGYAVFSNFGLKILVTGSSKGTGIAVDNAPRQEYFMKMLEMQAGLGFGVKKFRLVWVFQTQAAFDHFVNSGYEFGGQATAAAQASGSGSSVAGAASISPGVWLYQITDEGIAVELTVKGAKYYRDKDLD